MNPKYIVYEGAMGDVLVMFPAQITHADIARDLGVNPIGAGFVRLESRTCFGKSTSLGVGSRFEDSILLKIQFFQED